MRFRRICRTRGHSQAIQFDSSKYAVFPVQDATGVSPKAFFFPFFSTCEVMGVFDVEFLTVILSAFVITRIDPLVDLVRRVR